MAVTIKDVAKQAGVSTATVSHVINKTRFVSDTVRQKVELAIDKLGYVANSNARGLRSSISHRIGLIVPEVSDYFPVDIIEPIESVLTKAGYQLILGYTHDNIEQERRQIEIFNYQQIDGLLLFPAIGNHAYLNTLHYPVVVLDRRADGFETDAVMADDETAVYQGVSMLAGAGHRNIGILIGHKGISTSQRRYSGYVRAVRDLGLNDDPRLAKLGINSYQLSQIKTKELLDEGIMTAVFAGNISITIGALKCLAENNVKFPQDMAVLGWGDSKWTELINPPLSVIRHPNQDIGKQAASLLLRRLRNPGAQFREKILPVEFVRRGSF